MNIQTFFGRGDDGSFDNRKATIAEMKAFFEQFTIWDSVAISDDSTTLTCSYGEFVLSFFTTENSSQLVAEMTYHSGNLRTDWGSQYYGLWFSAIACETEKSLGIYISGWHNEQNRLPNANNGGNNQFRFVLSEAKNLHNGQDEKCIVISQSSGSDVQYLVTSEGQTNTEFQTMNVRTNAQSTNLIAAFCASYCGYCPHVFIPITQNIGYSNGVVDVGGQRYYSLGGTLYIKEEG